MLVEAAVQLAEVAGRRGGAKEDGAKLKGRASAPRSLAARLVLQTADRLVVEFEVPEEGFDWSPGTSARLKLADGKLVEVEVDLTTSTAPGELRAGTIVRLVLRLKRPLTAKQVPASVALPTASLELVFSPGSP